MRVLLGLLAMMCMAHAEDAGPTFGNPSRFTEQGGAAIYNAVCAGCHMPDGRGASGAGTYPSLLDDVRLEVAAYPIDMVLKGHGAMPPFGWALTDNQVAAVVGYVRTHFGNRFDNVVTDADVAADR
jgi:mono/diheme cytochrome c family protein